jgi:hypothetical protein
MKQLASLAAFLLVSALASAWQYPGAPPTGPTWGIGRGVSEPKREKPPEFRTLTGVVLDKDDTPLKEAIVYLKNRKTKKVVTFIADDKGAYRFPNLSRREDYEVYAERKGEKSSTKTLSSFDGRTNAKINLYIEAKPEAAEATPEENTQEQAAKQDEKKEEKKDAPKADDPGQPPQSPPQ